jgi:Kef-type K+ transport system membrane component KefB
VAVAVAAKVVGCAVGSRGVGFNTIESVRVGVDMVSRGEVGLIVASVGLTYGIIEGDIFSMMIIMVLVTTMITPLLLRRVFPKVKEAHAKRVFESVAHLEDEKGTTPSGRRASRVEAKKTGVSGASKDGRG